MPLFNTAEVLAGARRPGSAQTYVHGGVTQIPSVTTAGGTVTISNGQVELDGYTFNLDGTLDMSALAPLLQVGCYKIAAVPSYLEPASIAEAQAAGVNYFVETVEGESSIRNFMDPALEAALNAAGGLSELRIKQGQGTITSAELNILNQYENAHTNSRRANHQTRWLDMTGIEYILMRVSSQDNRRQGNILETMSPSELAIFKNTNSHMETTLIDGIFEMSGGGVGTFYNEMANRLPLMSSVVFFQNAADAAVMTNGIVYQHPEDVAGVEAFYERLVDPNGSYQWTAPVSVRYYEYYAYSVLPYGQHGTKDRVHEFLTFEDSPLLGRVNPIYGPRYQESLRLCNTMHKPGQVTKYSCPVTLATVCVDSITETGGVPTAVDLSTNVMMDVDTLFDGR